MSDEGAVACLNSTTMLLIHCSIKGVSYLLSAVSQAKGKGQKWNNYDNSKHVLLCLGIKKWKCGIRSSNSLQIVDPLHAMGHAELSFYSNRYD